ncbi:PMS1 protein homolog 1 [Stegastes partitus]|uniref:PMS1 homolog 1, mismatch repair system component n=1 Tax=Stegastes partitus TaxID=144197 RepID=A0A3B4Z1X2_9TELE|nr:PREDICTED: PMS1 protein homolog 1 [Stegastes partitus]XP_008293285.1 PREDICTED: PMS1 protein homolog 1 [Stegastes partitus]
MKQLPSDTVRLLSSSQVITSVVNVVKELLENSLDAGASSVDVKLENYGLDRIEVRDNGRGIKAADTPVMAVRHFTSKICSHEDLERLETYGFRGEALGSICAVAEVAVTTKTEDDDISTQYMLDSTGKIVSQKPSHLSQGTTVSVLKLFKNLPVRRQCFSSTKKCKDELKKVQDVLMAYAIVKPELRLVLVHNKVVVWQKAKVADNRSALLATLGPSAIANLLPCHHHQEQPEIVLEGFFPKPGAEYSTTSSSNPDKTFIFVNDRPVQLKEIMKLLRQHYSAQYPDDSARSRYPTLMLKITVPPSSLDVNLTPDKTQVLLHNKEAVLTAVEALLVSLYGFRSNADLPAEKQLSHETFPSPSNPLQSDASQLDSEPSVERDNSLTNHSDNCLKDAPQHGDAALSTAGTAAPLHHQTSNCSSSSSIADDWIVNQIPVELVSNFSLYDDEMAQNCAQTTETGSAKKSPERLEDDVVSAADTSKVQILAEDWSRGTALTDPISGEPLQPVILQQPSTHNHSDSEEVKSQSSSSKKTLNAITEKRAALTAYDLISNRAMRAPLSPAALFEKEARAEVLREKPTASLQDISVAVHERWKNLGEEDRKKYEEKAKKHLEHHDQRTKLASAQGPRELSVSTSRSHVQGQKRKATPSNQQLLDELFSAQPQKKMMNPAPKPSQPLPCSMAALRLQLQRLSSQSSAAPRGLRLVNRLASQSAWVILCGQRLMLLNPFRVEEALLFKRLLENNILPAVSLQNPIQLTDGNLGGAEYTETLCNMEKHSPELNGGALFSDPRLVANGFKIKFTPGLTSAERHLEVTAMADCVPFLGVEDLREILTAVLHKKARTVQECRPLKVTNYLQGEAVRLARQLPANLSREDVEETLLRMERQLGETIRTCIHGRPFLQHLSDIPATDQEAEALMRPLEL